MSEAIKSGDTIKVNYTGKFGNGEVFDSSEGREPIKFTVGEGKLLDGFELAAIGMKVGEKKTVTLPPEEAYGERSDDNFVDIPREAIPDGMPLTVGMQVPLNDPSGKPVLAKVAEIQQEFVRMDINHVLAGATLIFDIEIVETGLTPDEPGAGGCAPGGCCGGGDADAGAGCGEGGGCCGGTNC